MNHYCYAWVVSRRVALCLDASLYLQASLCWGASQYLHVALYLHACLCLHAALYLHAYLCWDAFRVALPGYPVFCLNSRYYRRPT